MASSHILDENADLQSVHVLIADDSVLMQERLKALLNSIPGISVIAQAEDVTSAKEAIQKLHPNVVIMDLHLPGNGIQALESIKAQPDSPIIIMFTAFSTPMHRQKCLALGADYFFDKTSELKEFQATLKALASQKLLSSPG